jgi:hypothetical protein
MLVFGAIRNRAEAELTLQTFKAVRTEGAYSSSAVLVASRWREEVPQIGWIRMQRWIRNVRRVYYRLRPEYRFNYGFVTDEETQIYLEAADVLFIPRRRVLNSGNIALGMTFGRVVVGPDSFNVGEILKVTRNPVFDPELPETAADAVREGFRLAEEGTVGESNRRLAMSEWKPSVCAASYVRFFEQLIGASVAA